VSQSCAVHRFRYARRTESALTIVALAAVGALTVPAGTSLANAAETTCLQPTIGLMSLWRGEGSGADSQNTNHGVLEGEVTFVPGKVGDAFDFDGVDDALLIPASPTLTLEEAFTVEFWFSFPVDVLPGTPRFTQGTTLLNKGWDDFFALQNGGGDLELGSSHPRLYSTTVGWLAGTWYHTALTYDAGQYHLYVNGVHESSVVRPDPLLGDLEEIYFSHSLANPFNPPFWWAQRLDEIAIYNRALTADEVAARAGTCEPAYNFTGFYPPVDNLPVLNAMNAGRAVPVKFSLGGDHGMDIITAGFPKSEQIPCDSTALVDGVEETLTAGTSGLTYDPPTTQYKYTWKTNQAWVGTCRQLVIQLNDGTYHRANFKFN
jgi:hypothetical protein